MRAESLGRFNALGEAGATRELLTCCASPRWAAAVVAGRPYMDAGELVTTGGDLIGDLGWADVEEALAAHPRIGERAAGDDREAAWSRAEQAGAQNAGETVLDALRRGNQAYEERFGHVYLVCATGRGAEEMLGILLARLGNDPETERDVVRRELAAITRIRLAKLVGDGRAEGDGGR
jgi:2-oxo-4-hydroxy-4-carboxy-5-ureidoimidazoline decarboxylase